MYHAVCTWNQIKWACIVINLPNNNYRLWSVWALYTFYEMCVSGALRSTQVVGCLSSAGTVTALHCSPSQEAEYIVTKIKQQQYQELLSKDQLSMERNDGKVFLHFGEQHGQYWSIEKSTAECALLSITELLLCAIFYINCLSSASIKNMNVLLNNNLFWL